MTESSPVSLFGSSHSDFSDTKKPSVDWSNMYSLYITSLKKSSLVSNYTFSLSLSLSSLSVMSSMIGTPSVYSNMGYWSKLGCYYFFASSFTIFTESSDIGTYIHSLIWISFPLYKYKNKFPPYSFDSLNDIPGMLLKLMFFCSVVYHGVRFK